VRQLKTIVVCPHFHTLSCGSNIALTQPDSPGVQCYWEASVCPTAQKCPPVCIVSGWGIMEEGGSLIFHLQQTQVPVLENEICERNYYFSQPGGITASMPCAVFVYAGGQDS
ncbi:OVCH1 protein, partial [Atlantisia rogersi]|nr:OVCH1 protein [Atlantisia rogersi]